MRFRVIEVVSAAIQLQPSKNVRKDPQISTLMQSAAAPAAPRTSSAPQPGTVSPTGYPNGLNFSKGRKVGAGFLNMFFWGTGSFAMGDVGGGLLVGGLQVTSEVLYIIGWITINTSFNTERVWVPGTTTSYGYGYTNTTSGHYEDVTVHDDDKEARGVTMVVIGAVAAVAHVIVSHARPYAYDKSLAKRNGTYFALGDNPLRNITVAMLPGGGGAAAVNLAYSFSY
jgi:hypothetical protein